MRVFNLFVIPQERSDRDTGKARTLRVAAYEYFKKPQIADEELIETHKRMFWRDICLQRGWVFVDAYMDMLKDDVFAWSERTDFERLLKDCRAGKVDMIITRNMSRFCADIRACMDTLRMLAELDNRVDVLFLQEGVFCSVDKAANLLEQLAVYEKELKV